MMVLGIHCGHDSSCAVVKDGRIIADAQEERFNRVKHSTNVPTKAMAYCMKEAGTICWVAPSSPRCWAHTASDSAPMLCALGAEIVPYPRDVGVEGIAEGLGIPEAVDNQNDDFVFHRDVRGVIEVLLRVVVAGKQRFAAYGHYGQGGCQEAYQ